MEVIKWTIEALRIEASKFETRTKFHKNASGAYEAAKKLGIFNEICSHMPKRVVGKSKWNEEVLTKLIKQYSTIDEFRKNELAAKKYIYAHKLNHLFELIPSERTPSGYWNITSNLQEEALKYKSRSEFSKCSAGAYVAAKKAGVFENICQHMESINLPNNFWNEGEIRKVAKLCTNKVDFHTKYGGAYSAARRLNILDKVCEHMDNGMNPLHFLTAS